MHLFAIAGILLIALGLENGRSGPIFLGAFLVFVGISLTLFFAYEDRILAHLNRNRRP